MLLATQEAFTMDERRFLFVIYKLLGAIKMSGHIRVSARFATDYIDK